MSKSYIQRRRAGKGFVYYFKDYQITDKEQLSRLKSLRIPPAWRDVNVAASPNARIQATGMDKAGRLQYIYHPKFKAKQEKEKFERILRFADALPKMRRLTREHLALPDLPRQKVLACIVQLMDKAYFRVGNQVYAKENQSYGLTTLRSKHTSVRGDEIIFDFIGKSGQPHFKKITDRQLAKIIKQLDELPGYEIFKYRGQDGHLHDIKSDDVNAYIKEIMGDEFTAKDFRTWGGTLLATMELSQTERPHYIKERKKAVTECVKKVAQKLGNTPAIARESYIDPRVIKAYMDGDELIQVRKTVKNMDKKGRLSADELCVLKLLQKSAGR